MSHKCNVRRGGCVISEVKRDAFRKLFYVFFSTSLTHFFSALNFFFSSFHNCSIFFMVRYSIVYPTHLTAPYLHRTSPNSLPTLRWYVFSPRFLLPSQPKYFSPTLRTVTTIFSLLLSFPLTASLDLVLGSFSALLPCVSWSSSLLYGLDPRLCVSASTVLPISCLWVVTVGYQCE